MFGRSGTEVQPLTDDERARLCKGEDSSKSWNRLSHDVITGLIDIRDNRLYRKTHDTFEAYCSEQLQPPAVKLIA